MSCHRGNGSLTRSTAPRDPRGIDLGDLIALHHADDGLCVSVVSAPALGRRWWATKGGGTWADGRKCTVSGIDNIADAQVNVTLNDG